MLKLAFIAGGGALGALLRYAAAAGVQRFGGGTFPIGTLAVNLIGCLAIGLLGGFFAGPQLVREEIRLGLLIGLLGAFTTFSTYGWETIQLANSGQFTLAAANVLLSNLLGLAAVWAGYQLSSAWFGA